ncbi:MAG: hypothetical protein R3B72_37945 [Polyangiaceae bacterium]
MCNVMSQFPIDTKNAAWLEIIGNPGLETQFTIGAVLVLGKEAQTLIPVFEITTKRGTIKAGEESENWYTATSIPDLASAQSVQLVKLVDVNVMDEPRSRRDIVRTAIDNTEALPPLRRDLPATPEFIGPSGPVEWSKPGAALGGISFVYGENSAYYRGITFMVANQKVVSVILSRHEIPSTAKTTWIPLDEPMSFARASANYAPNSIYDYATNTN